MTSLSLSLLGGERQRVPTGMRGWTKKDVGGQGGAASPQIESEAPLEVSNPPDHPGLPGVGDGGGGIDVGDPLRDPPAHQRTCASSWCLPVSLWNNQDVRI